jgi:hypothetical protein
LSVDRAAKRGVSHISRVCTARPMAMCDSVAFAGGLKICRKIGVSVLVETRWTGWCGWFKLSGQYL